MQKHANDAVNMQFTPPRPLLVAGGFKPYPEYKPISLPWLSKVPGHWSISRNKNLLLESKTVVGERSSDYTLLSLTLKGVIKRDMENPTGKFPSDFATYKVVHNGDLIFCLFDMDETPRTVGISSYDGMITGAYDVFSVKGIDRQYFYYYYLSVDNAKAFKPYYSGLRKVVGVPRFLSLPFPVPPLAEQRRIVAYLDEKTAKIDRLIQLKEREIELLNEKKQAMISKVVTGRFAVVGSNTEAQRHRDGRATSMKSPPVGRGLRPRRSDELVDSGVDWIGQVPKGWKIDRLSHLAVFGKGLQITKEDLTPTGTAVISYGQIHSKTNSGTTLAEHLLRHVPGQIATENPGSEIYTGDIVFADTSEDLEGIGNCVLMDRDETVFAGYHTVVVRLKSAESAKYFACLFRSNCWRDQLRRACNGVKVYSVTRGRLSGMGVLIPPLPEQREIVAYLDAATAKIDAAAAAIEKSIGLLKERRTRLVSDAVTGRIDLRSVNVASD